MVIQCKNLIRLYILPDQRRGNLLVDSKNLAKLLRGFCSYGLDLKSITIAVAGTT